MSEGGHHDQLVFFIGKRSAISSRADGSRKQALFISIPLSEVKQNQAALHG